MPNNNSQIDKTRQDRLNAFIAKKKQQSLDTTDISHESEKETTTTQQVKPSRQDRLNAFIAKKKGQNIVEPPTTLQEQEIAADSTTLQPTATDTIVLRGEPVVGVSIDNTTQQEVEDNTVADNKTPQDKADEESAQKPYNIPTFRTPIEERPQTDSFMAGIDARVDVVADDLARRYKDEEAARREEADKKPLWYRAFVGAGNADEGMRMSNAVEEGARRRQATGADRIIKEVMTFNDQQKADLDATITEQINEDKDYQIARAEYEEDVRTLLGDKQQLSDSESAEIMQSLTPEQKKQAEEEVARVQAEIERLTNTFNLASQEVAKRVSGRVNNDIINRIIDRLATRNMPQSDLEYIGKAIHNNSVIGMLYETAVKAASGGSWIDYAVSAKGLEKYDASTAAKIAGGVGALLVDSGIFSIASLGGAAAAGAINSLATRIVATRIAQGSATTLAKGALKETAKRIATSKAINRLASNIISQSVTLGSYDAASSILQQNLSNPDGIDWVEVLKRAGSGAASGAAIGVIGAGMQTIKGMPRVDALKAKGLPVDFTLGTVGLLAENAAFVGVGSLVSGEEADWQSFAEGLATLGILKGVGALKAGLHNPFDSRVRSFAERTLSDLRFTAEEEAAFRKAGIDADGLGIIRSTLEHIESVEPASSERKALSLAYNEAMASKDVPLSAKVKLQYIVTGRVQNIPDVLEMKIVEPTEYGEPFVVNSYDRNGRLLSISEFADGGQARAYINKYKPLIERNTIAQYENMVNGVSRIVALDRSVRTYAERENVDAQSVFNDALVYLGIVKGEPLSDERKARAEEVISTARNASRNYLRDIIRRVAVRNEASSQEVWQALNVKPYLRTGKETRLVEDYVREIKDFVGRPIDIRSPQPDATKRISEESSVKPEAQPTPPQGPTTPPQNPSTPPHPSINEAMRARVTEAALSLSKLNSDEIVSVNIQSSPFGSGTAVVREGYVVMDGDGDIDRSLSDSTVVVEFEDGHRATVYIDDIAEVTYQGDVTDMVRRAEARQEQTAQMLDLINTSVDNGQSVAAKLADGTEGVISGVDEYENYIFTTKDEQGNDMSIPLSGTEIVSATPIEATQTEQPQSKEPSEDVGASKQAQEPEYDEDFPPLTEADFAPTIDFDTIKWVELSPKDWTDTMRMYGTQTDEAPDAFVVRSARSYYLNSRNRIAGVDKQIAAKDKEIEKLRAGLGRAINPQDTIKQSKLIQKVQSERDAIVASKDAIVKEMAQYEYALREYGIDINAEESLLRERDSLQRERAELVEADAELERTNDKLASQELKTIVNTEQNRNRIYNLYVERGVTPEQAGLRQAVLWDIATGNVHLRWEDGQNANGTKVKGLASELGLGGSAADKRAYKSIVAKNGDSIDAYVHSLWEQRGGYTADLDDIDMKNEVLDVLQSAPNGSRALEQLYDMLGISADREEGFGQSKADIEKRISDVDARIATNQRAIADFNKGVNDVIGRLERGEVVAQNATAEQPQTIGERTNVAERTGGDTAVVAEDDAARGESVESREVATDSSKGTNEDSRQSEVGSTLLDAVKTLYSKGKAVASKLFSMQFFDVAKTPKFMQGYGLTGDKFTIKYGVIARHVGKDGSHTLTESDWEQLPDALQSPFAIAKLTDKENAYRLYTTLQIKSGEFVVVGVDVKNAGRDIEVNAISTAFGRRGNANLPNNEEVIYKSEEITPEQSALLERPNFAQYPTEKELSENKGNDVSSEKQEIAKKVEHGDKIQASPISEQTQAVETGNVALFHREEKQPYQEITYDNFYLGTVGTFDETQRPDRKPDYVSYSKDNPNKVSSMYWYGEDADGKYVIRGSDHWSYNGEGGNIASCYWYFRPADAKDYIQGAYSLPRDRFAYGAIAYGKAYLNDMRFRAKHLNATPPAGIDAGRWNAIVDMVKDSVGAENVITDPVQVKAEYDRIVAGQQRVRERIVEDANSKYNEQLRQFANGTMRSGDKIQFGTPSAILLACGIGNVKMSTTQRILKDHIDKHILAIDDIKDLPQALENPLMVYRWGTKAKSFVIITEIPRNEERIAVAVRFREEGNGLRINHIASVHGKSVEHLIDEMATTKSDFAKDNLKYVDKERTLQWLATGDSFGPSVSTEKFDSATKIIKDFENPKVEAENLRQCIVYHGSSADFEAFDHSHMGEGEGTQVYGWGTYVTEVNGIARSYAEEMKVSDPRVARILRALRPEDFYIDEEGVYVIRPSFIRRAMRLMSERRATVQRLIDEAYNIFVSDYYDKYYAYDEEIHYFSKGISIQKALNKRIPKSSERHLYTVDIPDDNGENYLKWDARITTSQAKRILAWLENSPYKETYDEDDWYRAWKERWFPFDIKDLTGEEVYSYLERRIKPGDSKVASQALSDMGFVGMSYPAQYRSDGRSDGARNYVIFDEKNAQIIDHERYFRTPNGEVYGFTIGNRIYLDSSKMNPETPIHEYTELWSKVVADNQPELWARGKELLKETKTWKEVNTDKNYKNLSEDERASETLSRITAKIAAKKMSEIADDRTLVAKLRAWLRKFWKGLKGTFEKWTDKDLAKIKVDDFVMMPLRDLIDKVDLTKYTKAKAERANEARLAQNRAELDAIQAERDAIITKAKADGTYMKAPNGKPTRLTEREWVDVRTPRFKQWFGDWEKAAQSVKVVSAVADHGFKSFGEAKVWARNNVVRTLANEETGGKGVIRISNTAVNKYLSESAVVKSDSKDVHLSVLKVLPDVIRNSVDVEQHADYNKGSDGTRSAENAINPDTLIHRLYGAVKIDGNVYRVKITLKEDTRNQSVAKKAYSYEATKIELLTGTLGKPKGDTPSANNSISVAKILNNVEKSHGNGEKVLDFSHVVDENGEPLAVYHGTSKRWYGGKFNTFDTDNHPVWFTPDRSYAEEYSTAEGRKQHRLDRPQVYSTFLNMRNVKDVGRIDYGGTNALVEFAKQTGIPLEDIKAINAERYREAFGEEVSNPNDIRMVYDLTNSRQFKDYLSQKGYDGMRALEGKNTTFAAFYPNQVKSATDNIGTYDTRENDIRFMFAGEKGAEAADRAQEATARMDNLAIARKMEADFKERPARLEKLRNSKPIEITGNEVQYDSDLSKYKKNAIAYAKTLRGTYTNKDTGAQITLTSSRENGGVKEILHHDYKNVEHLQSVAAIKDIIENSIFIASAPNNDNKINTDHFDYYVCGLKIGGKDYTVKAVITTLPDGTRYYDHKLTKLEKGNLIDAINKAPDSASNPISNESSAKPSAISDSKDIRLFDILKMSEQENAKKIKRATGWERGADGKWRYEIPDAKIKDTLEMEGKSFKRDESNMLWTSGKLGNVVEAPDLFDAYPQLKDVRLETDEILNGEGSNGYYDPKRNVIVIHADKLKYLNGILNHEIQHAIQRIEGFAQGGNSDMLQERNAERVNELQRLRSEIEQEVAEGNTDREEQLAEIDLELGDYDPEIGGYDYYRHLSGEVEARNVERRMKMTPEERRTSLASATEDVAREDQVFLYDNLDVAGRDARISESAEADATTEGSVAANQSRVDELVARLASLQAQARNRNQDVRALTAEVIKFVKDKTNDVVLKNLGEQRFRSIMNGVQAALAKITATRATSEWQMAEIRKALDKIDTRITEALIKDNREAIEKLLNLRVYKFNPMGVKMGNRISENTRQIFDRVQAGITLKGKKWSDEENRYVYYYTLTKTAADTSKTLAEIEREMYELPPEDNSVMHKIAAVQILKRYNDAIVIYDTINEIEQDISQKTANRTAAFRAKQKALEVNDFDKHAEELDKWRNLKGEIAGLQADLLNRKHLYNDALATFRQGLETLIEGGRNAWIDAVHKEAEQRANLMRIAFSSIRVPSAIPYKKTEVGDEVVEVKENRNNELKVLVSNALPGAATFDSMLRAICINDIGNRYGLYDEIMGGEEGLVFASDNEYKNKQKMFSAVEEQIKAFHLGKNMNDLIARAKMPSRMEVINKGVPVKETKHGKKRVMRDGDGNIIQKHVALNVGELMYIYASSRQEQGRKMLINAGIDEMHIDMIADYFTDKYPDEWRFVNWVTDEFLPTQRYERYNGLYEDLYKTQMPDTPHYFPLVVNKEQLYKAEEIGEGDVSVLPTSTVGSIIARREHNYGLNLDTNFVGQLISHINDMEHWYAFAKPIKQINTLLSSTQFRNVVEAQAKGAVSLLKEVANIAVGGQVKSRAGALAKPLKVIARNDIASNITFRFNTALKQTLSYPAYFAYSASPRYWLYLARAFNPMNIPANWKWAINELPTVKERWESRSAGFDQLNANDFSVMYGRIVGKAVSTGMLANSTVDLLTCTIGARAVYEFEYNNNIKSGMTASAAEVDAKYRAAVFLNQTQQSGNNIFLSRIQKDGAFSQFMAYRNANLGYARLETHAIAEAMRAVDKDTKRRRIAARKDFYKRAGMNNKQAEHKAKHDHWQNFLRAVLALGVFGGVLPYLWSQGGKGLLGYRPDDDDDEGSGISFVPYLSDYPFYGPAISDVISGVSDYQNQNLRLSRIKLISSPTLETFLRNAGLIYDRLSSDGKKADRYDTTVAFSVATLAMRYGIALDPKTFENMYHGVKGMTRDGMNYEDIMEIFNVPRSSVKAIVGRIREGETKEEYMQRLSFANRRIRSRSNKVADKKIEEQYFEALNNKFYKEMGISPSEVDKFEKQANKAKNRLHLTAAGYVEEDYLDDYEKMPAEQAALVDSLGNRIYDLQWYDYGLKTAIEPDSIYKADLKSRYEVLKQLNVEYDKYMKKYGN